MPMKNTIEKIHHNSSGIYSITNTINGKVYIGSAYRLIRRFYTHLSTLNSNTHANKHLQQSYNKHGAIVFEFRLVELCDIDSIKEVEQCWINKMLGKMCYNMASSVGPTSLNVRHIKTIELISPDDEHATFTGTQREIAAQLFERIDNPPLLETCYTTLNSILSGKKLHLRGWRLPQNASVDWNAPKKVNYHTKTYDVQLVAPDGIIYGPITNLAQFCREHGIENESNIHNLIAGRTRYVNGWSVSGVDSTPKNSKAYNMTLIDPNSVEHVLESNLTQFAKDHGLNKSGLQHLVWGKLKTYKGWKLA